MHRQLTTPRPSGHKNNNKILILLIMKVGADGMDADRRSFQ